VKIAVMVQSVARPAEQRWRERGTKKGVLRGGRLGKNDGGSGSLRSDDALGSNWASPAGGGPCVHLSSATRR
jgi:hypothetical protein